MGTGHLNVESRLLASQDSDVVFDHNATNARAIAWKPDGTRLYVLDAGSGGAKRVHQHPVAVPWRLATTAAAEATFNLAAEGGGAAPLGLAWKPDGTAFFTVSQFNALVRRYPVATPWDITTAGAADASGSVAGNGSFPHGLAWRSDGTKLYTIDVGERRVGQFAVATAWDPSTIGPREASLDVIADEPSPSDLFFRADGAKVYIVGGSDAIHAYPLATPWDVATAGASDATFSVAAEDTEPAGIAFKPDGGRLYIVNPSPGTAIEYRLETPWDITTAAFSHHELFDSYVLEPVDTAIYEAPEIDLGLDVGARVYAEIETFLGPGQSGESVVSLEIDYRTEAGAYHGFEPWSVGEVTARFIKGRIVMDTAQALAVIKTFKLVADAKDRAEKASNVTVAAGGTAIAFAQPFVNAPFLKVWPGDGEIGIAAHAGLTTTGFTAHVYDGGAVSVGGTLNWEASGV